MNVRTKLYSPLLLVVMAIVLGACASAEPRFSPDVQQSFREQDMYRMDTDRLQIYYPRPRRDDAIEIAHRLEQCLDELEDVIPRPTDWGLVPVFITETEFNNAYVSFRPGTEPHIVLPTSFTTNLFGELGFTPSIAAVGCHEMVHYVHFIQIHGVLGFWNWLIGPSVNPQIGFDAWFFEGLATYYESSLVEHVGRYGSPIWENYFASGIATSHLDGGRLSMFDRGVPFGGHYLVGSKFVGYLADTYGEEKLWELVDRQGRSFFFPLGISFRFLLTYGKPLGTLLQEFESAMRKKYPPRTVGAEMAKERWVGRGAALEEGPDGKWALFSSDVDQIATLEVFDGEERILRRNLPDILPGRTIRASSAIEGLRFSPDGQYLYFLAYHLGRDRERTSLVRLEIARNRIEIIRDDISAVGGDIFPGGDRFLLAQIDGATTRFWSLDLRGGEEGDVELFSFPSGAYVGWVRVSPTGDRAAFTLMEDEDWTVAILDLETQEVLGRWTTGKHHVPVFDPQFLDENRVLFVAGRAEGAGRHSVQVFEGDVETAEVFQRSQVPYMAFNARQNGEALRYLSREGWGWALYEDRGQQRVLSEAVRWEGGAEFDVHPHGYQTDLAGIQIHADDPYRWHDGLFFPRLRMPSFGTDRSDIWVTGELSGRDELGFHNWALTGRFEVFQRRLSGSFAYVNTQLAPWYLGASVGSEWQTLFNRIDPENPDNLDVSLQGQRIQFASLQAERFFYDIPLQLSMTGLEVFREDTVEEPGLTRRLVGPTVATGYSARRGSAYGGSQWLLGLSTRGSYYAAELGSDFSLGDGRGQLEVHTPLPFSGRHRLRFSARARGLVGVPEGERLLQLGGFTDMSPIFSSNLGSGDLVSEGLLPPGFFLVESLRGYEDFPLAANEAGILDLNYRYPIIVDRGAASVFYFLPSFFFRQFDLELFGSAATLFDGNLHGAVGVSADASVVLWVFPVSLRYQVARRLFDDQRFSHVIGFGGIF